MDYDDKDFQCHNFQLVGEDIREDNNKFPSVLRSFALPSFDLDDHLRVHLRFDSLVEPSNILGISGQEENNWIDSFSAGGGAVGFSSNVGDSCSISRNNNVWSEATSSESVEILLKSVGEDDMMETKTESEQCDGDNILNNLISTSSNLTSIVPLGANMEDLGDVDTTAPPEKSHNHSPENIVNAPSVDDHGGKPLSSEKSDLIGCQSNDAHANDTAICLSAASAEEHTHQEEPSIDQKCSERVSEENSLDCPHLSSHASDDPLISNLSDRSDASHLDVQTVAGSSSATATIMDVVPPEHSSASESTNRVSAEHGKVIPYEKDPKLPSCQEVENQSFNSSVHIDECSAAGSPTGAVNPSGSKQQNLKDSSGLLEGFTELTYSKKSDGLLEVIIGQAKLASNDGDAGSDMLTESKDKPFGVMCDVNDLNVDSEKSIKEDIRTTPILLHEVSTTSEVANAVSVGFHKESPELVQVAGTAMLAMTDKNESSRCQCDNDLNKVAIPKETSHFLGGETDKRQASEALVDEKPSDQESSAKSLVVKNPCKMISSDGMIDQPGKLQHENVCHMETDKLGLQVSSLTNRGSTELCHEDVMVAVSHDTSMSSSPAIITEKYQSATPGCMNPVSDSDNSLVTGRTCDSSDHAKVTLSAAVRDESPKREIIQKDLGDELCPKDHSIECVVSSKGDESLPVEAGNTNLSEHSCGSPNIMSLVQHGHAMGGVQEKKKGLADCLQATNDDLHSISNNEKASCRTESVGGNLKENNAFPDDKSFTFVVGHLVEHSEEIASKGWKPFSSPLSSEVSQSPQMTSMKSGHEQHDTTEPRDISQVSQSVSNEGHTHNIGYKGADIEKALPSTTASVTASVTRRKTKVKSSLKKTGEKRENTSNMLTSSFGIINKDLQSEEIRKHSSTEGTNIKSSCSLTVVASSLPDLNSTTTTLINQPFTDSQQVQLRAQIFVYGSLIQGIPPDEACMVSAFGDVDGGEGSRGKWEVVWRAIAEKYENQKSPIVGCETPTRPVAILDHALRTIPQSKVISNPTLRPGNKGCGTTIFSPLALPSPVWSVSTHDKLQSNASRTSHLEPSPVLSALHSFQSQHVRQYSGNGTHWLTQSPCPVPWVVLSNTSTTETVSKSSISPILDAVQSTPRDLTVAHGSNIQSQSTSSAAPATRNEVPVVSGRKKHASADQKSRRKKRDSVPEEIVQVLVSEPQMVVEPITRVSQLTCSSTRTGISSGDSSGCLASTIAPIISPTHFHVVGSGHTEPKIIFSGETYGKIEQAKLQAEDAASFAGAAVRHSEGIWKQLANQKGSGLVAEVDEKLASAAVAAAAAAAVAKAASAAAKLAADSAMQAKLMADEAMVLGKTVRVPPNCESATQYDNGENLSMVTPASILKCKEKSNGSHSIIPAAREGAQRKLEAASSATKKAENLDAIVKAAELAAEAVSQTGALVAMGEPLPISFSEILECGPEGYWKTQHLKGQQIVKTNVTHGEQSTFNHLSFNEKDVAETAGREVGNSSVEIPSKSLENQTGNVTGIASSTILFLEDGKCQAAVNPSENAIQEGSAVEVMSDVKGPGVVWYSARVLNIKDSKAYVCYNELLNNEGSDKIKEWIPLDYEHDKAPRIRACHPTTAKKSEGPRKRQRVEAVTHSWDVGDHVDAWITEGWREGVITEKSEEDLMKFVIHFPVGGDISTVGSWDLRPSLLWREGQWIEWSRSQMNISERHEGDTPVWKRRKITRTEANINSEAEGQGVASFSGNAQTDASQKPEDFVRLDLSAKDKLFHLGKGTREDNNSCRIKRTGLQKEGSRVVFGIPKPGKKRKFMDVSKHCVVENPEKMSESVKTSKHLIPQSSMGWKNVPKVDARSKRYMDPKPKIPKPVKPRNAQSRNLADKGDSSIPLLPSNGEGNGGGALSSGKSSGQVDSRIVKKNLPEVGIYANKGTAEVSVLHATTPEVPFVNKSTFDVESEKGNHTHASEISTTNEEVSRASDKVIFDTTEPRRSNRRIQPTSRLLEGLQSSLIIGKVPSASHDRGSKASHRNVASTRGHTLGS